MCLGFHLDWRTAFVVLLDYLTTRIVVFNPFDESVGAAGFNEASAFEYGIEGFVSIWLDYELVVLHKLDNFLKNIEVFKYLT